MLCLPGPGAVLDQAVSAITSGDLLERLTQELGQVRARPCTGRQGSRVNLVAVRERSIEGFDEQLEHPVHLARGIRA